jgi:hypothetical protein
VTQTDSIIDGAGSFIIDEQDNVIIDLGEDRSGAWWFSGNGLAPVTAIDTNSPFGVSAGYIDKSGEWVIEPRFFTASSFGVNGLAPVSNQEQKWGFINESGEWVIEPRFAGCAAFTEVVISAFVQPSVDNKTKINGQNTVAAEGVIVSFMWVDSLGNNVEISGVPYRSTDSSDPNLYLNAEGMIFMQSPESSEWEFVSYAH